MYKDGISKTTMKIGGEDNRLVCLSVCLSVSRSDVALVSRWLFRLSVSQSVGLSLHTGIGRSSKSPSIRLARLKFDLTNQDSAGEKNFTVLTSFKLIGKALKSGNFSHWRWH